MLALVTKTIERNRMLKKGDKIVVGVSGGADSVCLLDVLNKLKNEHVFIETTKKSLIDEYINHRY